MFFLLQIWVLIVGFIAVISATAVAVVWVKRQTHIKMTPGQLAQDRVLVATADTKIGEEMVKQEYQRFLHDRVLDARTTGNLRDALEGKEGDPLLLKSLVEGSPSPVKHQSRRVTPPFAETVNGPGPIFSNTATTIGGHEKKHLAEPGQVLLCYENGHPVSMYFGRYKPGEPMYQWRRDGK